MNTRLVLRPYQHTDLAMIKQWLSKPHVAKWYHDTQDWIDEIEDHNGEFTWIHHYIAESNQIPIGFCQYYEYSKGGEDWNGTIPIEGAYSIDYLIGSTDYLRKGYGKEIVACLIAKITKEKNAKCIIVQPEQENTASRSLLSSCGFTYDVKNELYILEGIKHEKD